MFLPQQNQMLERQNNQHKQEDDPVHFSQNTYYLSQQIAQSATKFILEKCLNAIDEKEAFKETLKKFSKTKIIKNIEEVNTLHLLQQNKTPTTVKPAGNEPSPLIIDSLLPKSADIDSQNLYKKNLKNMISFTETQLSQRKRKIEKQIQEILYHKLNLKQQNDDDGFTKQLRKMQEEKVSKMEAEAKAKQIELNLLNAKLKDKKKEREEAVSFDYNGSAIKLRPEQKSNLVSKLVQDKLNNNTKIVKEAFDDKNPTTVDSSLVKNTKKNSLAVLKIKEDVRFNQNRSLSEGITVGGGIKYTQEGKTLQGKVKSLSTIELKKSMHQRMLSRDQFEKVRSLNGSHIQLDIYSNIDKQLTHRLSKSQMYASEKTKKIKEKRQKIIVNNENLKKKLLQKVNDEQEVRTQLPNPEEGRHSLSFTDIFNMNYLKSGGNVKEQKQKKIDKSTKASSFSLPKIVHTHIDIIGMPKERQKLKEKKNIFLELRKRFEDKLRL